MTIYRLKEGNSGYKIIKCFEAICTGSIITKFDPLGSGPQYKDEIIQYFESPADQLYLAELRLLLMTECKIPNQMIEIFGCYRHFGHPVVNEEEGIKDLIYNTRKEIHVSEETTRDVSGAFNRMFIISFISRNNR